MGPEEIESYGDSGSEGRNRLKSKTASALAIIGWLVVGFNLNGIVFGAFPLKFATPEWQLNLISSLLASSTSLLIAASLIPLALVLSPNDKYLQEWNLLACRAASWFAIFLVVITPLQFYIGSRALKNQTITAYEAIGKLKTIAKDISSLKSEDELRAYVVTLPNSPRLPAKFDAAFPVIKQRAIDNIKAQINAGSEAAELQKSQGLQTFLKEAIRNAAQAILMAAGFSALAGLSSRSRNIVTQFFENFI